MPTVDLELTGFATASGFTDIACHLHFDVPPSSPDFRQIKSYRLPQTIGLKGHANFTFKLPSDAIAVSVTLTCRYHMGWLRHGRCRFDKSEDGWAPYQTTDLSYESSLDNNGKATLLFPNVNTAGFRGVTSKQPVKLLREWFCIPKSCNGFLKKCMDHCMWHLSLQPMDKSIKMVHMPMWNNKPGGLPGWFFAFERSYLARYTPGDFCSIIEAVREGFLGISASTLDKNTELQRVCLGWSLSLFGLSIQYQPDKHFGRMNTPVERFSSNARFDGIGDCEDIAKEICMAHGDLCKLREVGADTGILNLIHIKAQAKQYKCVMMLGTVARNARPDVNMAHAFAMLIPNWFFDQTGIPTDPEVPTQPMLCDGTYACYPINHKDWQRPWKHRFIVSALIMNEGEIYFTDSNSESQYGINFDDLFPVIKPNIGFTYSHERLSVPEKAQVQQILASNLPVQKKTFGFEHQSIVSRFVSVWSKKSGDFAFLNKYCSHGLVNPDYFHQTDQCIDQEAFNELFKATTQDHEMAYTIAKDGHIAHKHQGQYGSVARNHSELAMGGHTHHRETGKDYRKFNVPTPEDIETFITHRVFSIISGGDKVRDTEMIVTHYNVYELDDTNEASGLVAELISKYREWSATPTAVSVQLMTVWRDVCKAFVSRGVYDNNRGFDWKGCLVTENFSPAVFTTQADQDMYNNIFDNSVGVTIKQIPMAKYIKSCKLIMPAVYKERQGFPTLPFEHKLEVVAPRTPTR